MITECPVCHSEQDFVPRRTIKARSLMQQIIVYDVSIRCVVCPFTQHIKYTTNSLDKIDADISKYSEYAIRYNGHDKLQTRIEGLKKQRKDELRLIKMVLDADAV